MKILLEFPPFMFGVVTPCSLVPKVLKEDSVFELNEILFGRREETLGVLQGNATVHQAFLLLLPIDPT